MNLKLIVLFFRILHEFCFLLFFFCKNGKNPENNPTMTVAVCSQQVLSLYIFLARFFFLYLALKRIQSKKIKQLVSNNHFRLSLKLILLDFYGLKHQQNILFFINFTIDLESVFYFHYRKIRFQIDKRSINMKTVAINCERPI